ncbi:unnamed protein product [Bursaphelenchus xylophilus]|uniref:(pine wood nematode) hypothetical protein n=1 Tax=Bursaphelenchus xylophilus TaxID=6326 RepID=A0A1I7RLD9_BURXY|nr:unnamed protein product [Bursaphelenchus xylophilus]CAG9083106.1 unnamed protein product [Bursaphelenchus xylophilus]
MKSFLTLFLIFCLAGIAFSYRRRRDSYETVPIYEIEEGSYERPYRRDNYRYPSYNKGSRYNNRRNDDYTYEPIYEVFK